MGHILSRPIRPSLTQIHTLKSELSSLKHGNVIYFMGCGFMSWMLAPTSLILGGTLAAISLLSGVQYLDRTRDSLLLDEQRNSRTIRAPQTPEEDLVQQYKNSHIDISLHKKSFMFSLGKLPLIGIALLGCITTGNFLAAALLCAAVGYSTKQTFKSLNRWDDGLVHKKHLKEDLANVRLDSEVSPSGTLPDLSYNTVAPQISSACKAPVATLPQDFIEPSTAPVRKNKI